jgi:GT2 family glycosyltransferase
VPVVIPSTDTPAISVLMVMYGGGSVAIDAVASLVEHTAQPFEVIVVDNASADDSLAVVEREVAGARVIAAERNLGFGGGNNRATQDARAPIICLLNVDARVTSGWLDPLLRVLDDEGCGSRRTGAGRCRRDAARSRRDGRPLGVHRPGRYTRFR